MITENAGYNRVLVRWRYDHDVIEYRLCRLDENGFWSEPIVTTDNRFVDTVRTSLNLHSYRYHLEKVCRSGTRIETTSTSRADWCESLLPMPYLPKRPRWLAIYRKAWQLSWQRIVSSEALPSYYAYCDYPDNDSIYVWDTCFCSLFQRYAAVTRKFGPVHPAMATLDCFYARQQPSGSIVRVFRSQDYSSRYPDDPPSLDALNPPLFALAEWNYYRVSGDTDRLRRVLPILEKHYEFIETFAQDQPGKYHWSGDGSGWDNINSEQGSDAICFFVDLIAQQALSARHITDIASEIGDTQTAERFLRARQTKKSHLDSMYWNADAYWYCGLTSDGRFTRKTLSGMWPLLAGVVDNERAKALVERTLMNPACFLTEPMPLPVLARDEPGYNPKGEYWLGSAWMNISLMVMRALERYELTEYSHELAGRTLDAIAKVYESYQSFPLSLWECYAPEEAAPASHKTVSPDKTGGVREEFGGWTGCLINMLIEHVLGLDVCTPERRIRWDLRLEEDHGIDRLRVADVSTDLRFSRSAGRPHIVARSSGPYTLSVRRNNSWNDYAIDAGEQRVEL